MPIQVETFRVRDNWVPRHAVGKRVISFRAYDGDVVSLYAVGPGPKAGACPCQPAAQGRDSSLIGKSREVSCFVTKSEVERDATLFHGGRERLVPVGCSITADKRDTQRERNEGTARSFGEHQWAPLL